MIEITKLSKRLEELAQGYWEGWHILMSDRGWTLGPDRPDLKMSPFLLDDWENLPEEGRTWCRGQVALVVRAIGFLPEEGAPAPVAKKPKKESKARVSKPPRLYRVRALEGLREALKGLEAKDPARVKEALLAATKSIPAGIGYDLVQELLSDAMKNVGAEQERQCRVLVQTALNRLQDQVKDEPKAAVLPPRIRKHGFSAAPR